MPRLHHVLTFATAVAASNGAGFPASRVVPAGAKGGFTVETGPPPLTCCAVEVETAVTHSEERIGRRYAGLSDDPHHDAGGLHPVAFTVNSGTITIRDRVLVAGISVAAPTPDLRRSLHARHAQRLEFERSCGFDPVRKAKDLETLQRLPDPGERKP